ncbi:hypothetical protein RJ640_017528 [Escallonia rubra]|uniref:Pentatricopeptide repeat-containing protein n=1 Tax=Escallonia rubra TaxID=112253 RepID=A0AA88QXG6_9ASTE|nr:hypothetical protein RJ640_017528 [Escallonia rubra]
MSSLCRLLRRSFSTTTASAATTTASASASATSLKSLSDDLYKERTLRKLVKKFKKHSESDWFRTQTGIYEDIIRRLAAAKKFRWIEEILEDQKKYDDISDEGFAVRLIALYGKSGMFDHAAKLFDELPDRKCDRTVKSLNALLSACVCSKNYDKVDGFFRDLPGKLSVKPDVVSYNIAIKGFCEMGSLDYAVAMLGEMEKSGVKPDRITFNTLLKGLFKKGRFSDGERIWARMEERNVVPDIRSFNAKLFGLANEGRLSEAVGLFGELGDKGLTPDVFSYNAVITGCCGEENVEAAKRWYAELVGRGCAPDTVTFAVLVPFACEKGDLGWAFELCKDIFNLQRLVHESLLQLVVDGLVKESKVEEAKKLVQMGKSNVYRKYRLRLPSDVYCLSAS